MKITLNKTTQNKLLEKLAYLISFHYSDLFVAVIAHGSVATNEIIPYSDFDGLLIVKDEHIKSEKYQKFLNQSIKIIYQFDPLQHHGWFILKESDLKNYPQTYFPHELFQYSNLIYPEKVELEITLPENIEYLKPFHDLCASLERKINQNFRAKNDYQLKSFLSEIMLLPTFFLQAKNQKGIHKKDSFEIIKSYFSEESLEVIEKTSEIRSIWLKPNSMPYINFLLYCNSKFFRKLIQKYFFSKKNLKLVKDDIQNLNIQLKNLIYEMKTNITHEIN